MASGLFARWIKPLESRYGLDLRSLALLRVGLALVLLLDTLRRFPDGAALYSDQGVLPRSYLGDLWESGYWSLHALSGSAWVQGVLLALAVFFALQMLVGYRTRIAVIASWVLLVSVHNRNPLLTFAADDVFRAVMFWAMFLPLGARYSIDWALNTSEKPQRQRIFTGAVMALTVQQCFVYMFSAVFKTTSVDWWPDGTAVYYSLSFDQYATPLGSWLLNLGPLLVAFTFITLVLEWLGPLLLWSPVRTDLCRTAAVMTFIGLHLGFGATLRIGIFPLLSAVTWLAFIPTSLWEGWAQRAYGPQRAIGEKRLGLEIYYDVDCGFCKKVVHLIRTFLVLPPQVPLRTAQSDPVIHEAMLTQNSWVIVDWQGNHHYKWSGIAYVVSLSPVFFWLAPMLRWSPLMAVGTRIYETIANNRRAAGNFTKPFKFKPMDVRPDGLSGRGLSAIALLLLLFTTVWNFRSITRHHAFIDSDRPAITALRRVTTSRTLQTVDPLSRITRLDQSWSIFAPGPPRDDGWYVAVGKATDGDEVNLLYPSQPVSFDKPTLRVRNQLYPNMQWRTFFINLQRARSQASLPEFGRYLCQQAEVPIGEADLYFMDERTVPQGESQTVEKQLVETFQCQ
ncbi:MAG: HTTM domain-containing protein [Cyanobacteria bacterium P01_A01_bin.105]